MVFPNNTLTHYCSPAKRLLELGARNDIVNAEGNTPPMLYPLWCHVDKELKAFNKFKKRATK
jgi:hypothetical protein